MFAVGEDAVPTCPLRLVQRLVGPRDRVGRLGAGAPHPDSRGERLSVRGEQREILPVKHTVDPVHRDPALGSSRRRAQQITLLRRQPKRHREPPKRQLNPLRPLCCDYCHEAITSALSATREKHQRPGRLLDGCDHRGRSARRGHHLHLQCPAHHRQRLRTHLARRTGRPLARAYHRSIRRPGDDPWTALTSPVCRPSQPPAGRSRHSIVRMPCQDRAPAWWRGFTSGQPGFRRWCGGAARTVPARGGPCAHPDRRCGQAGPCCRRSDATPPGSLRSRCGS